jgi:cathepsin D
MQLNNNKSYTSFLEEKDINLHQQVLAQKRLATYYGELDVGIGRDGDPNKKQTFKMLFDTGSCEFWIPSDQCTTNRCQTHNRYTRSSSYESYQGNKMAIQYLSGKVEGEMALEDIFLGDLRVPKQVIGIADHVEIPLLDEVIWDGILGLAYANKNLQKKHINTLFDNIINQNILHQRGEKNQFAYYLGWDKGAITFGGADMRFKKNMDEEFKWAPISERNYWTVTLLDIKKYKTQPQVNLI